MIGKTLITTQQARMGGGNHRWELGFWVGRIKVTEITRQPSGTLWEGGVLGGEHRLYNSKNYLNWGLYSQHPPPPHLAGRLCRQHPRFL